MQQLHVGVGTAPGLLCMFSLRCGWWVSRGRGVFFSAGLLLLQDKSLFNLTDYDKAKMLPHWYHSSCSSWTTRHTLSLPLNSSFVSLTPSWVPDFGWPSPLSVRVSMLILAPMVQWRETRKIWSFNPSAPPLSSRDRAFAVCHTLGIDLNALTVCR